jgi:hypothetical protein
MKTARHTILWAGTLWIALVLSVQAITRISEFYATRDRNAVVLQWTTEEESGLAEFRIERSSDGLRWITAGAVRAAGESSRRNSYSYRDQSIPKTALSNLYYRLVLVDSDGKTTVHYVIASVEGNSGIRHTWGSIKAMFR